MQKPRITTEEFVKKARKVHGNRYDYSKLKYSKSKSTVIIICKTHGKFSQVAGDHLRGNGCYCCGLDAKRITLNEFVARSQKIHGTKYNYSNSVYTGIRNKLSITCKTHGKFLQDPNDHLNGAGCPVCGKNIRLTTKDFINRSINTHENKYDYSLTRYKDSMTRVKIICKKHGAFLQNPQNHMGGQGCVKCSTSISRAENMFLNKLNIPKNCRHIKIGKYYVDGLVLNKNEIYEFLGDFWHGNPNVYSRQGINPRTKNTYGFLYDKTVGRFSDLVNMGYKIKYIWESDWKRWAQAKNFKIPIKEFTQTQSLVTLPV